MLAALLATAAWPAGAAPAVRPWPAGRAAPPLALTDLDGKPWQLAAVAGHPVLLNFWATWCEPCRAEMPSLARLAADRRREGLVVVTVNFQETAPAIRRFLGTVPVGLPVLLDPEGDAAAAWTPRVFPSTVLIDRTGTPRSTVVGGLDWTGETARTLLEPLLATPGTSAPAVHR